ncbi:Arylesterase precursor [Thioalkalivibrio nitratireducens DSM 14787]|uniref:Arylesterase n=1 Tax=Thioalkalivibrio nitratireducens (strain DSM 14787 / UNIQEM 213 / ALEN2) TaxID=1255043 RepID=L0DXB5_THIND|nr:Arylesterase precursor [Thioalkalivibrio nitratireducens DSM 14787]
MFRFLIAVARAMVLALTVAAGAALPWTVVAAGNASDPEVPHRLLVFGDSLSAAHGIAGDAGWVTLLERRLMDRDAAWKVHNASVGGETTAGGRTRLPTVLEDFRPDLVILELGGNDGLRGLSLRAMRANLEAMLDAIDAAGAQVLLVGIEIPPNYGPRYTERFSGIFAELAEARALPLLPFLLDGVALDADLMLDDGIHPAAGAQPRILKNVWAELEPLIVRIEPEGVPQS